MSHYLFSHNYYVAKIIFLIENTNKNEMFFMFYFGARYLPFTFIGSK